MGKNIKCKSCGGLVLVEDGELGGVCQYCGTYQKDEDAVSSEEMKKLLYAAEGFMKIGKYADADGKFLQITRDYPQMYHGWWGLIRARSRNLTDYCISKSKLDEFDVMYGYICQTAKGDTLENVKEAYGKYSSAVRGRLKGLKDDAQREWDRVSGEYSRQSQSVRAEIEALESKIKSSKAPSTIVFIALSVIWGAVVIFLSIFEDISNLPAGIFGFIILILPIWWICTKTIDSIHYKKIDKLKMEIVRLENKLREIERQERQEKFPIEEKLTEAGDI